MHVHVNWGESRIYRMVGMDCKINVIIIIIIIIIMIHVQGVNLSKDEDADRLNQ